ncbi:TOMM precursor leader peptide-binding protein [Streptantibioticus silvisoli]|uniref:TOMM leader peptide-binding protein n=1 Tax=Streptantibioticus silvisoli TaxID=2705255 RepID=A0ABT6VTF0_9ACTN|nr:TOMM precursor leader peptide-binding protein [Streptantibioticus silvisoli]MDI5961754.1 TOMM precursor leader peptide-binding protein [Streptantibioticus silvisoli]
MRAEAAPRPAAGTADTADTADGTGDGAAPWAAGTARFQAAVRHGAAGHGVDPAGVSVRALGARDELAAAGPGAAIAPDAVVHLYGHQAVVGPFPAGRGRTSGCPRCLVRRWQSVRPGPLRDALELGSGTTATGEWPLPLPFVTDAVAALVAAARQRAARDGGRYPSVHLVDLETLRVDRAPLVADPECPSCGVRTEDTARAARIAVDSAPKADPAGFRLRPVDAYELSLEAFVNPVTGMLGPSVAPDLVSASTASTVGAFTLRSGSYLRESYWGGHTGGYRRSVRVGLLEGMERFAGMRPRGRRTTVVASLDELGADALDPRACGVYSDAFYAGQDVTEPFAPDVRRPWVWGWSLRDERPLLVPEVTAYYHAPGGLRQRFVQESSNGRASGGAAAEAVYYGLMEVVERDAFLVGWYGRARLPEIDPYTSRDPATVHMVQRLEMYGYRARFFDNRISFPVPVVTAVAQRIDGGTGTLCFGAGASWDPEAALGAGLCEIATDAVNLRARTVRDRARLTALAQDFDQVRVLHDHPLVYGLPAMARHADFLLAGRDPADRLPVSALTPAHRPAADLREDLAAAVAAVTARGFDVVVVDQTMPAQAALGLHTVAVIVPGLVPIDFGWSRQRALRMPRVRTALREAGLLDRDLAEADLNPAPHPFP